MSKSRKDALLRLNGLDPRIPEHLTKIKSFPNHRDCNHWIGEVRGWLQDMEAMIRHVGKKTGAQWQARIEAYRKELEEAIARGTE